MKDEAYSGRETILENASTIFHQKGYADTNMREIAAACGIKAASIYNHFTNKESILYEVIRDEINYFLSAVNDHESYNFTSQTDKLRWLIETHLHSLAKNIGKNRLVFETDLRCLQPDHLETLIKLRKEYEAIFYDTIRTGMRLNEFETRDARIASFNILSILNRTVMWFSPKGKYSLDETADIMTAFVLNGLVKGSGIDPNKKQHATLAGKSKTARDL